ncbi:MAG: inositol monophosphatase [Ignavibacteria bacterium]|nr:inositol monophosphatase [Ignavibacteria bacterium]
MYNYQDLLNAGLKAAKIAGEILRNGYGTNFIIESKSEKNDLVTEFDKKSEIAIIDFLKSQYPESDFLAEESGLSNSDSDLRWIIDPLDGTVNFAHGIPIFAVSIAAEYKQEIVCGVIYQPLLQESFTAIKNGGAFFNSTPIRVSNVHDFSRSFLVTGFPYNIARHGRNWGEHFLSIVRSGVPVRRLGSAALDLAYTAAVRFDGFWEIGLSPWDVAAGILLVKEAGGLVMNYEGDEYSLGNDSIIACTPSIYQELSERMN